MNYVDIAIDYATGRKFFSTYQYESKVSLNDFSVVLVACVFVAAARLFLSKIFVPVGRFLACHTAGKEYANRPANHFRWINFGVQSWKVIYHTAVTSYAWYHFSREVWWFGDFTGVWRDDIHVSVFMKRWTFFQVAYHVQSLIFMAFEESRKDFWETFIHHILTCCLSSGGYLSCPEISMLCTQVHDLSDIALSVVKINNHLKLKKGTIVFAVVNLASWIYFRLYLFPVYLVYATIYDGIIVRGMLAAKIIGPMLVILVVLHVIWLFWILASYKRLFVGLRQGKLVDNADAQDFDDSKKK